MQATEAPSPADIEAAERELGGIQFPHDYRDWLLSTNGVEGMFGEEYVMLYALNEVVALTQAAEADERLPGFVAIGSDGGGELLAFDFRNPAPPVVMINAISSGWHEGLLQAPSFAKFLAQREAGEPYRRDENHR